jgi:peptidoglycan/xylan/chitin deacetylase (PgdA/CDA1 family)
MTGTATEFWPNRLARTLVGLAPDARLPPRLQELLGPMMEHARQVGRWSTADLDMAISLTKQLGDEAITASLDEMEQRAAQPYPARAVLNESELSEMAESGLVRFGSHTRTHCRFDRELPPEVLEREIAGSRADIAARVGAAGVDVFCYPNGDTTPAAVDVVRRNYTAAVTTRKGWHEPGSDLCLMRRVGMHEDVSNRPASFLARVSCLV